MAMPQGSQPPSIEMSLREHLLAVSGNPPPAVSQGPNSHDPLRPGPPAGGQQDSNIDPGLGGPQYAPMDHGDGPPGETSPPAEENRKGRRELSTSKRAAQNRAAQRAFRQRKEEYIKSLRTQVKDMNALEEAYKAVQAENSQLRDYIIILQGRLLDTHGSFPDPPANINLADRQDHANQGTHHSTPAAARASSSDNGGMNPADVSQLQRAAAAASAAQQPDSAEANHGKMHHEEAAFLNPSASYSLPR